MVTLPTLEFLLFIFFLVVFAGGAAVGYLFGASKKIESEIKKGTDHDW